MLHFAGQNKIASAFYIFWHSPNSTVKTFTRFFKNIPPDFKKILIGYIKIPPSGRRTACISDVLPLILHTHFTFLVNPPKIQNSYTSCISWFEVSGLLCILHFLMTRTAWSLLHSSFYIWECRSDVYILHLQSTAGRGDRPPYTFNVQRVNKIGPRAFTSNISEPPNLCPALVPTPVTSEIWSSPRFFKVFWNFSRFYEAASAE